jgi:TM2 domain-containing membrane protein YozV
MPTTGAETSHFSSVDTWKHPDRNYFNFIVISVLFGLFGLDHFYLRSFQTGGLKILLNVCGLGIWYFWDLIQIFNNSKKVRAEGLDLPFDWGGGIGRGVFVELTEGVPPPEIAKSYKDFFVYGLLTIFLGFIGAEKFYIGDTEKGLIKMLSILSIYPILLGLIWVIYDIYIVIFAPQSIMDDGIITPFPFSMFPWLQKSPDKLGEMFMPKLSSEAPYDYETHRKSFGDSMLLIWNWPPVKAVTEYYTMGPKLIVAAATAVAAGKSPVGAVTGELSKSAFAKSFVPPETLAQLKKVGEAADKATNPSALLGAATGALGANPLAAATGATGALGANPLTAAAAATGATGALGANPLTEAAGATGALGASPLASAVANPLGAIPNPLASAAIPIKHKGGAIEETNSSGPVIAGTLAAIVFAGGLKALIDMASKQ